MLSLLLLLLLLLLLCRQTENRGRVMYMFCVFHSETKPSPNIASAVVVLQGQAGQQH
jgi:hypothetical protein